jgi:glucosylglycerate synthase
MVETSPIPEQTKERMEQIGTADLVIGLLDARAGARVSALEPLIREGLASLTNPIRTVLLYQDDAAAAAPPSLDPEDPSLRLAPYASSQSSSALRTIATFCESLNAKGAAVIASDLEFVTPQWFYRLAYPLIEKTFDLVCPAYVAHKYSGLLNTAIVSPLTRALYGKQLASPMGPDFGFSTRFLRKLVANDQTKKLHVAGAEAIAGGFQVCEANLGERHSGPVDWKNLSSILADVLAPLYACMDRDAALWQRMRGSEAVPTLGDDLPVSKDPEVVDTRALIESFQLGLRNLQEIWGLVLPPTTLLEIKKLSRVTPDRFRIPDELWARIVYDFGLGFRVRTISRDHLLRAMTPLYLGWVASYALEFEGSPAADMHQRVERLAAAYEAEKPYIISRWRWPDRFNP